MAQISNAVQRARQAAIADLTDGQLLASFVERHDQAAFTALVNRHGSMVWGVCRRLLNHHDAEDAFQAAFLVLSRKAAAIKSRHLLGNWLYGVAHQAALQARRINARRRTRERQVADMPEPAICEPAWHELLGVLDAELSRLPDRYRSVIVLCDLEGQTRKEAGRHLGCPEGTVAGRLSRARTLLAKRLARLGFAVSGGVLATAVSESGASPGVPTSAVKAAMFLAGGHAVPAKVAALAEGVMSMTKVKTMLLVLVLLGVLGWGGAVWSRVTAQPELPIREVPMPDLSGTWQGDGWGTVVLRAATKGEFEGTYTDTYGKAVGRIKVRWSVASRQYEGTWSEGTYRFGRIALEVAKDSLKISGAYTTDPKCEHQPGVPSLAGLRWAKVRPTASSISGGSARADEPLKQTILRLDKQLWDAAGTGDWKAYDPLIAADFVGHSSRSGRSDKAASVNGVKHRRYTDATIRDAEVQAIGKDVAVLTYVYSCQVLSLPDGTVEVYHNHYGCYVWARREGAWVLVSCQDIGESRPAVPKR
jgi:RNA polymerase sigma factor (sigma-70 family)